MGSQVPFHLKMAGDPRPIPLSLWVLAFFVLQFAFSRVPPPLPQPQNQDSGPNTEVAVFTIPVGQGDSTVIKCPNGDISIVDMGCKGGCQGMSLQQYIIYIETEYFGNDYKKLKKVF